MDYVVEMRRYDETRTLSATLERGELHAGDVAAVGRVLARFHEGAPHVTAGDAPVLAAERRFDRNLHELLGDVEQRGEIGRVQAIERFAHAFVTAHAQTLAERAGRGLIRDGHGDLRAEHVLLGDGIRVVDCVEFDRELRELDVADDLAFLVFDLAARGGERFAAHLVQAYRAAGGDPGPDALIAFYAAYRALVRAKVALVRAKVALVRAAQLPGQSGEHGHQSADARDLIGLAERFAWRARLPLLLVVCGVPASGKSHLARALAERSALPHLSSDVTRKRMAGLLPTERASSTTYSAEWNARTYAELGRSAAAAVATGGGAIVDATFRHRADRTAFVAAFGDNTPMLLIECHVPPAVLAQRSIRRQHRRGQVSDADAAVVQREQTVGSSSTRCRQTRTWRSAPTAPSRRSSATFWLCSTDG